MMLRTSRSTKQKATPTTAADFRGELAKRRVLRYEAAAAVRVNPQRFSLMLNERIPLTSEFASRLQRYLEEHDRQANALKE
jgi:plasmid maintenance system antidote protein VapI